MKPIRKTRAKGGFPRLLVAGAVVVLVWGSVVGAWAFGPGLDAAGAASFEAAAGSTMAVESDFDWMDHWTGGDSASLELESPVDGVVDSRKP